jgi:hypothetical protein
MTESVRCVVFGYYERDELLYASRTRNDFTLVTRARVVQEVQGDRNPPSTIYTWRKQFGQLEPADVKRLRRLEQENGRLKKLVAERDLEIEVMKEITQKTRAGAPTRRRQVLYATTLLRSRCGSVPQVQHVTAHRDG